MAPIRLTQVHAQAVDVHYNQVTKMLSIGIDYQKVVKIDRENEIAPPPKVPASTGSVRAFHLRS